MDTNERLNQLLRERGWTYYRLSKNSGLSEKYGYEHFQKKHDTVNSYS